MTENTKIEIKLSARWYADPPKYKLYINDILVEESALIEKQENNESKTIVWEGTLDEGESVIRLQLLNKGVNDTIVDANGTVKADKGIVVESVSLDDIDLGVLLWQYGELYPDKNLYPHMPEKMSNMTYCSHTGEWRLKFNVPTYIWFLELL